MKFRRAAFVGAVIGATGSFIYSNTNALERMAAEAKGMPLWSWHQLPFVVPWAVVGALCAIILASVWKRGLRIRLGAKPDERAKLTELFRVLGATSPEGWAASQIEEGVPQLHRFLFLRQAWKGIYGEDNTSWIDAAISSAQRQPDAPYASIGKVLATLRSKGVSDEDITDLVRCAQAEFLFRLCYLLEDPDITEEGAKDVGWGLFTIAADGTPGEPITGLHESVLETDPTGREMRPRRT